MKYIGEFRSIDEKLYTIEITTKDNNPVVIPITLGGTPITVEVTNNADLFKPLKLSQATITVLNNDILKGINTPFSQGTSVVLKSKKYVVWSGYATPNVYSQDYVHDKELIEINCIDGLSTLQYKKYSTPKKSFKSVLEVIDRLINECHCYTKFYIPTHLQLDEQKDEEFFRKVELCESNFFDDNGEWYMDMVLNEICKFFGLSCTAMGDTVIFMDYDGITYNKNEYFRYTVGDINILPERITLQHEYTVDKDSYSDTGTQVNLSTVYSTITVRDKLYTAKDILTNLNDIKRIDNKNGAEQYERKIYSYENPDGEPLEKEINVIAYTKFFKHNDLIEHYYDPVTKAEINGFTVKNHADLTKYIGGTLVQDYSPMFFPNLPFDDQKNQIKNLNFTNNIVLMNHNATDGQLRKVLTFKVPAPCIMGGNRVFLVMNGSAIFKADDKYDTCTEEDIQRDDDLVKATNEEMSTWLYAELKVGGKYFTRGGWSENEGWFMIPLVPSSVNEEDKVHFYNTEFNFSSNINYLDRLHVDDGFCIQLPEELKANDDIEFSFIQPVYSPVPTANYSAVYVKNFNMTLEVANRPDETEFISDTEYKNVIDDGFINDFDGEEFRICTWDNKAPNYNSLIYRDTDGSVAYIDKWINKATGRYMRAEEHYIHRLSSQYSDADKKEVNINLYNYLQAYSLITMNISGKEVKAVIDSELIDYRLNTNKVKLIERL